VNVHVYTLWYAAIALIRVFLAAALVFWVFPLFLFPTGPRWGILDLFFANIQKITVLTVMAVYVLAPTRFYELASLIALYVTLFWFRVKRTVPSKVVNERVDAAAQASYDILERRARPSAIIKALRRTGIRLPQISGEVGGRSPREHLLSLTSVGVMLAAGYLRFYDPVEHAAPALSDAYVTLAWMKYFEARQVFHDGIYPSGFHIMLSAVRKISAIDPLLVLKFMGPLVSVLTVVAIYYFVSRTTKSYVGGLVGAFVYGVLPQWLPLAYERQSSTNSQEFGMLFLLPVTWFVLRYLTDGDNYDLSAAACGIAVVGLVHPLPAAFLASFVIASFMASVLGLRVNLSRYGTLIVWGLGAVVVALLPIVLGWLKGIPFHGASANFLWLTTELDPPEITMVIVASWAAAGIGLLANLVRGRQFWPGGWLAVLISAITTLVYMLPYLGIKSAVLYGRSPEFMSLGMAVSFGAAASALTPPVKWSDGLKFLNGLLVVAALGGVAFAAKPTPATPYKMQSDVSVDQYLRIADSILAADWMIVGNEENYDLVLGVGWHMHTRDFIADYDPTTTRLWAIGGSNKGERLRVPNIFVFSEKRMFTPGATSPEVEKILEQRKIAQAGLNKWVEEYRRTHENMTVYYEDDDLVVWYIYQPMTLEEQREMIWGPK